MVGILFEHFFSDANTFDLTFSLKSQKSISVQKDFLDLIEVRITSSQINVLNGWILNSKQIKHTLSQFCKKSH